MPFSIPFQKLVIWHTQRNRRCRKRHARDVRCRICCI